MLEASIRTTKEILFCKQTGFPIGIMGRVWYLIVSTPDLCTLTYFVYIAYEVRIKYKGPLRAALYVDCYLENQFYVFQTAPVVVYRLMTSVFSTSHHRCY